MARHHQLAVHPSEPFPDLHAAKFLLTVGLRCNERLEKNFLWSPFHFRTAPRLIQPLRSLAMPILPASSSVNYGAPIDFSGHLSEFEIPYVPGIVFVRCISVLTVDVGPLVGSILLGFLVVYARVGGRLIRPLPYGSYDGDDDASSGVE
ncbi:uncharacterized protein LOC130140728 [Syzygium oleosum]|uniref:uncharacterized protein LOC130140728 n=1 Tax=Syzygium oleosum TaxID=219896 RepID=UPI0024B90E31|nr:uncharacterized protein LOC130140728 [Syzygium oleosum]